VKDLQAKLKEEVAADIDDNSTEKLEKLRGELGEKKESHKELLVKKEQYDIANSLLKDGGIKTKIIRQYVPIINKLMNKYLAAMDFFVQFELDENFDEKIKSRFRDEFTYESFSEGEKMRIDLALLFTWRAVAKLRNSSTTNLLIMDEVFDSSLDTTGTDEFLKIITDLNKDTNVFVISHKGDQLFDKFHSNIKFEKIKNFSQIAA
jgi:DNA repair exonuclease SbcCD ATPase subunit